MSNVPRVDRLYHLLPAIYQIRDAEQGYPLQALLRVINEQADLVEDNIAQLYENFFIETAQDWAVPYVADLVGYRPVEGAGNAGDGHTPAGRALNRVLVPRREVANSLRYRRRKGTLSLLTQLAHDIAGWPAQAVEFYRLLGWHQNINHLHRERARTVDLRQLDRAATLNGPFDTLAHTVEVRRPRSHRQPGRYNIPSVGVFLWRLKAYGLSQVPPCCLERAEARYSFSFLGQDTPLFNRPGPCREEGVLPGELQMPVPISRLAFSQHPERYYGAGKSLALWAEGWLGADGKTPVPLQHIVAADLSDWRYTVPHGKVAIDPELGRFAFPRRQPPKQGVRVSYHYGFSTDMGGGEYGRTLYEPSPRLDADGVPQALVRYTVDSRAQNVPADRRYATLGAALARWRADAPDDAVIELLDSNVYAEPLNISVASAQRLQIRAANRARPALRLLDYNTDRPDPLLVTLAPGAQFTLDGLLIAGRPLRIEGAAPDEIGNREAQPCPAMPRCDGKVVIRHCTLVPGWGMDCNCEPDEPEEPSLVLVNVRAAVSITRSIVGAIQISEDEVHTDPIPVSISDSIVDATGADGVAIGTDDDAVAHALLTLRNSTVFGIVNVHAVVLAENTLFTSCVNVARRQLGCMRFCYVPPRCRTPRRYHCQPDGVVAAARERKLDPTEEAALIALESVRVVPRFTAVRYGKPGYAQLAEHCAEEICHGAEDESEMGAFHDLYQPQREANLRARLDEYTPAGYEVGMFFVT